MRTCRVLVLILVPDLTDFDDVCNAMVYMFFLPENTFHSKPTISPPDTQKPQNLRVGRFGFTSLKVFFAQMCVVVGLKGEEENEGVWGPQMDLGK